MRSEEPVNELFVLCNAYVLERYELWKFKYLFCKLIVFAHRLKLVEPVSKITIFYRSPCIFKKNGFKWHLITILDIFWSRPFQKYTNGFLKQVNSMTRYVYSISPSLISLSRRTSTVVLLSNNKFVYFFHLFILYFMWCK